MSGGTTQQSGTSTSVNQIPQWMSDAGQQNYAYAQQVAEQPLQQYQGQMVADTSPQTQQSYNVAANSGNVGADQYDAASAGYLGALGQTPNAVTPQTLASTDLSPYMNPYTQSVINATLPGMQQANALSQNQAGNAANAANAFGGSRQGIQQGVAQAQGAMNIGQMLANLNSANFTQAQTAATGDISRNLQAQTQNQNEAQAKINSDIQASQGLTNTGDSMNKSNVANFNMLQSAGASESMQAQNEINAQMAKFQQAFSYPQQQLGTLESSLGMTPHDTSTAGDTTSQTTTPTDWASIISKGASAASDIYGMSDKSMKTDITKLGKDPKTGLDMHAFRYKGDPKSYPKVVGPMAQDVQKIAPDAVTPMGKDGKLAIRGYAGGTSFVLPDMEQIKPDYFQRGKVPDDLSGVADPTPAGQAGLKNLLDRGYAYPKHYAAGTPFVQPSLAPFMPPSSPGVAKGIGAMSAFRPPVKLPRGATVPMMPKRFAGGIAAVPGDGTDDTVQSYLTPGEAVLTPGAAEHVGRPRIAALNAMHPPKALSTFMPPVGSGAATMALRAGARGMKGALANTKLRPKIVGGLSV